MNSNTNIQASLRSTTALTSCVLIAACALFGSACSDDDGSSESTSTTTTTSGMGGMGGSGGDATGGGGAGGMGGGASAEEHVVMVRGELFTTDLMQAQAAHDQVAAGGEDAAKAAGDFGHDAMLGTTLLGTTQNAFLGLDRWNNLMAAQEFYSDPQIAMAFGMLFATPPNIETFTKVDWHGWGDLTSGDADDPHWFVVIRGRLAESDPDAAQMAHDTVAAAGEMPAMAAGDLAHVVHLGAADSQEFFAIDIWDNDTNIEAFYTDPNFVMAFSTLFSNQPTVEVYQSTDWHQW